MERYLARRAHGQGMAFDIVLILNGHLDLEKLRQAWTDTIHQHPRLFAILTGRGRRQRWKCQPQCSELSFVYHAVALDQTGDPWRGVNPQEGMGVRCAVQTSDQITWSIRVVFHHACCDGVGAIRVFGQFAKRYGQLIASSGFDDTPARHRTRPSVPSIDLCSEESIAPPSTLPDLRNLWTTIRGSNVRLSKHAAIGDRPPLSSEEGKITNLAGHHRLLFSETRSDQLRLALKAANLKLNDWAIAITMQAVARMTDRAASPSRHIMVLNPVETRNWSDRHDTHNHIGLAFVRRTHQQLREFDAAMQSISKQMNSVRKHSTATEMESGISVAEAIPGGLSFFEWLGTFTPTASLTSLTSLRLGKRFGVFQRGNSSWIGDAEIRDIYFDAPIQRGAELSIAAWDYGGRLSISCRTDPDSTSSGIQRRLLEEWSNATTQWLTLANSRPREAF